MKLESREGQGGTRATIEGQGQGGHMRGDTRPLERYYLVEFWDNRFIPANWFIKLAGKHKHK